MADKIKTAGYSGNTSTKKLGIKPGFRIQLVNAPEYYFALFTDLPGNLNFNDEPGEKKDMIHFFTQMKEEYLTILPALKKQLKPAGMIWVSWPKKSSRIQTDVTESIVRTYAIETGLVDIKVCAIDEIWSGLKLVIPIKNR